MIRAVRMAFLVFLAISLASCQTFQYSRGWTNGKRAESSPLASILDFKAVGANPSRLNSLQAPCASLHRWKMFLRSNDNEVVCRVPCEFLDALQQCLREDGEEYRRGSAPALEPSTGSSSLY